MLVAVNFLLVLTWSLIVHKADASEVSLRSKRQSYYYICGTYPNQYYSIYPCEYYNQPGTGECMNGGTKIGVGCYYDYQCTPYSNGRDVECSNYCCCTKVNRATTTPPNLSNLGYCYNGQRSNVRCTSQAGCASGQTCVNGLCCTRTGNEWQGACGGLAALAVCNNYSCGKYFCTSSNFCCECQYGRTSGLCTNGCSSGFSCSANGYCCPSCPNGQTPYGSCYNNQCAAGYVCRTGNICCSS